MSKKIISWLFVIIWLFVIFYFSATNGTDSLAQSKDLTRTITEKAYKVSYKIGIIKEMPNDKEMSKIVYKLNPIIRKIAHVFIYFVLAILLLIALGTKKENLLKNVLIAIIICFAYSLSDEIHQTMVGGRDGKITDCLIDTAGAIAACMCYTRNYVN